MTRRLPWLAWPLVLCLTLNPSRVALPDDGLPGSDGLVVPDASLEALWQQGEFTEGGALAADGSLLFSDIGNRIMRFDPRTKEVTVYRDPSGRANGLIFDPRGRLIAAEGSNTGGNRRVSITEPDGSVRASVGSP